MYVPSHFSASDREFCYAVILQNPLGELVTTDPAGAPFATRLPFVLDAERNALLGHMARANRQSRHFETGTAALAIFHGPHPYVSPGWHETQPSVPTWNYVAVHVYGTPKIVEDRESAQNLLRRMVEAYERGHEPSWSMDSLPSDYLEAMMRAIVAFELPIERLEGKAKLSQNRSAEDRRRVAAALARSSDDSARATARAMKE